MALVVAVVALLALVAPASAQVDATRLDGGLTAAGRAVAWSQASFADGAAPDVIIARDDEFADALGSGAVQGALEAPLLLTDPTLLSPETAAEIARLGADRAIILGGEDAIGPTVVTAIEALGLTTERIGGATRIETAVLIVERFFPNATQIALARAFGTEDDPTRAFADSLALAPFSAAANTPVLFTSTESLDAPTAEALATLPVQGITLVGGTAAVSDAVADAALAAIDDGEEATEETLTRVTGDNRFATAVALAAELGYSTGADAPRIILAEGQTEDAWTSGFPAGAQAGNGAATVLANGDALPPETQAFLAGAGVELICGPGVSTAACDAAVEAVNS